jgi:hypothetical protein
MAALEEALKTSFIIFCLYDHQISPPGEMMHQATASLKVAKSLKRRRKCTKSYDRFTNFIYICILCNLPFSIEKEIPKKQIIIPGGEIWWSYKAKKVSCQIFVG